jgi:hypothetical protein
VDTEWVTAGAFLLALDTGLVFALRRRVPVDRMSLLTLPVFIAGVAMIVAGVM